MKRGILVIVLGLLFFASCGIKRNTFLEDKVSKKEFIEEYRRSFFLSYMRYATNKEIVKIMDDLNDMSYKGDGGNLPSKYLRHPDSIAKRCIEKAERIIFNPGESPKTFLIFELEKITRGNFLDSIANVAYKDYRRWYRKEK
ncbi:hypothetical protein [Pedobacter sp.]|uniref:hypothetical protein n=1 Tax=Pedobacter sp. TaxID=1411316 RepID=UPI0031DC1D67